MRYAAALTLSSILALSPVMASAETPATMPVVAAPATAAAAVTFTDDQKAAIQGIIKDYLTKEHPEVIMLGVQEMQNRDKAAADQKAESAVKDNMEKLFNNPDTPVGGNPKGDVKIVEFFDFNCGYCKMSEEATEKLLKEDGKIKFYYKDFPILGPVSKTASRAALAAVAQGKYVVFHDAMMAYKDHLAKDDDVYAIAKTAGLDVEKLKKDMNDGKVDKIIAANLDLANAVGARGTPLYIIGDKLFPGAMQYDQMKDAVAEARKATAK